jgi:DNA-binding CsgD family transcriptional regulator
MALGVTKAEARLAVSLLAGKSMQEHADAFQISKNTVRTQIKSLFNKTDTRGQAGLVRRLTTLFSAYRQV